MVFGNLKVESVERVEDKNPDLYYYRALRKLDEGKIEEALEEINKSILFSDNELKYLVQKAFMLDGSKRYEDALGVWKEISKVYPSLAFSYYLQSIILYDYLNRKEESYEPAAIALAIDFENCKGAMCTFDRMVSDGRAYEAIKWLDYIIKINFKCFKAYEWKGIYLSRLGNSEDAIQCFREGIKVNPNNIGFYIYLGVELQKIERFEELLTMTDSALTYECSDIEDKAMLYYFRAISHGTLGDYKTAINNYETSIKIFPFVFTYEGEIKTFISLNDYKYALNICNKAINAGFDDFEKIHFLKGEALKNLGKSNEAIECYEKALAIDNDYHEASRSLEQLKKQNTKKSGCFLTTAMCDILGEKDDCYELEILRSFRDKNLLKTDDGSNIVDEYYRIAPEIANKLYSHYDKRNIAKTMKSKYIEHIIGYIKNNDNERAICRYKEMVLYVKNKVD